VKPGERIHVETNDCFHGVITPQNPHAKLDYSRFNPVTGPIFIEGALPGDILSISIHDIRPNACGVAMCGPHSGQLCHTVEQNFTRFFDVNETTVTMREESSSGTRISPISFPACPMLGVIGLSPEGHHEISTMPAGKHGGNLDNKLNGIGCTIHIPVHHPGGLLSIGDMHASQGDGEINGTGVEVGGDVLLSCEIIKPNDLVTHTDAITASSTRLPCEYPVTETKTHWITHGVAVECIPKATKVACEEAAALLMGQWGFSAEEAFIFLGVKGDLGLCQSCHPDKGTQIAKMAVPKIKACPAPFRLKKRFHKS
jgi:amidase